VSRRQLAMFRRPQVRASFALPGELVVDSFAGGGGASTGIEAALGRPVDIAINHDAEAIAMHRVNHPRTKHYLQDIWKVDPREACGSRPVGLAWFSPDCTHHSRAKGGSPRKQGIRDLAWVVIRWAKAVRPRMIVLENVEEWASWGPLVDGQPDKARAGQTFRQWLGKLTALGYSIEFRSLVAADYGTPTTRRRLYLIARRDQSPIVWPEATHGKGREHRWIPAAAIIDWSLPCPSIFERKRPLAEATQRRIAEGIRRYVLETANPFIVRTAHGDVGKNGSRRWGRGEHDLGAPLPTVCASRDFALAVPTLIARSWGERVGQTPRVPGLEKPLGTVVSGGVKHALVAAFLSKHFGGVVGHDVHRPIGTVTARDHHAVTTAWLTKFYGTSTGSDAREPLPTVTGQGQHIGEVRAFLTKFYSAKGGQNQDARLPLHTVTSKARFGLVTIAGEEYAISDIGMRMLAAHELYAAQGFPSDYVIDALDDGSPLTKTAQIKLAGNSVCPPVAEALVAAQVGRAARRAA